MKKIFSKKSPAKRKVASKKRAFSKKAVVAKKKAAKKKTATKKVTSRFSQTDVLQYLVNSEENQTKLMIASSMGLTNQ